MSNVQKSNAQDAAPLDQDTPPSQWTLSSQNSLSQPSPQQQQPCKHIIIGPQCNHGPSLVFTGRIHLAGLLQEVSSVAAAGQSIVVTKSFGNAEAVREIEEFVWREQFLTVKRNDKQCTACAVKLAHLVGAIVVVA
jgi:hypothetical protein